MSNFAYRLEVAALHFNENSGRDQAKRKSGTLQFNVAFPKYKSKDGGYSIKKVLSKCTYSEYC
jgi:solute carrier family 8 (sodium/calcium exchanger)